MAQRLSKVFIGAARGGKLGENRKYTGNIKHLSIDGGLCISISNPKSKSLNS